MRKEYDAAMFAFDTKHKNLFIDGERRQSPNLGSSMATAFWGGYEGMTEGMFNFAAGSKNTLFYAYYRAGQDAKKKESL